MSIRQALFEGMGMVVKIVDGDNRIDVFYTESLLISEILQQNGIGVSMPCAGNHTCGKCFVAVSGSVSAMTEKERALLGEKAENCRLACMTRVTGDCEIVLPKSQNAKVLVSGFASDISLAPLGENFGFAVDIGTTTVAVYLYDLKTGTNMGYDAFLNPQSVYGADVISRIEASLDGKGQELAKVLRNALQNSFEKLCKQNGITPTLVDAVVITGNTTMMYLLLCEDVKPISRAPFEISNYLGEFYSSHQCGIVGFENAKFYIPRTMSAFVGSDITCSVLSAVQTLKNEKISLIIDIGTNGEMVLLSGGELVCCSTAAGPAFEGAGITMGSIAADGAINKVYIEENKLRYTTVNGKTAVGICGSGLIDAIAVFLQMGLIDDSGCIDECNCDYSDYITEFDGGVALKIGDSGVVLTQKDIRAVQLAKAAVCAGVYSLINEMNIQVCDIEKLLLAGGFGSFTNVENAAAIGLIPKPLVNKTVALGNAAGMGACAILLSKSQLKKSFVTAEKSHTLELSSSTYFMEKYVECMMF